MYTHSKEKIKMKKSSFLSFPLSWNLICCNLIAIINFDPEEHEMLLIWAKKKHKRKTTHFSVTTTEST